jgi:hypothetical protein
MEEKTLLHRQIHPSFVQNDVVSSQAFSSDKTISSLAFTPSEKDKDKLSVYNGAKFTAKESFNHYTSQFESYGVLSVSISECLSIDELNVAEDNYPYNGHAYIDFSKVESKAQKKKKAGKLRDFAILRKWTYSK